MAPRFFRVVPLLALLFCGCTRGERPVHLVVAAPLTGDLGLEGQGVARAVRLAVEEATQARTLGFPVSVLEIDDRADPEEAVHAANLVVSDPSAVAVIGHYSSDCARAAAPVYARAGIPMIMPSASNTQLTLRQKDPAWGPRNVFRMVANDDLQGKAAAEFIFRKLGVRRLAMVHDETAYGRDLSLQVRKRFEELGGRAVSRDEVRVGEKDFSALTRWIKSAKPDAVHFGGFYTEAGLLIRQLRAAGIRAPFIAGDGAKTGGLFAVAGAAADGAYLSTFGPPLEQIPAGFAERYKARYAEELKPFDHFAYEAAWIVLDALGKYGPDRGAVLAEIRRTDRAGILGRVRFDENGDAVGAKVAILRADAKARSFVPVP